MKKTDVKVKRVKVYFVPVKLRFPLKFGTEIAYHDNCLRVCIEVEGNSGKTAEGWGEIPVGVAWSWPSDIPEKQRETTANQFCIMLAKAWSLTEYTGHPMEIGNDFNEQTLPKLLKEINTSEYKLAEPMPYLAALVCNSAFDMALHDAYGNIHGVAVYDTYNSEFMNYDLSHYLTPAEDANVSFEGKYPSDFLISPRKDVMLAWHLVGGLDPLSESEINDDDPDDGYPLLLTDWIKQDGLKCLKVKLRGNDSQWDYDRLVKVGTIAMDNDALWLTTDFNCTVKDPEYVNSILDKLVIEHPHIYQMILYVEQPFPYDLEKHQIDVHSLSARKPLFMDESAHDWKLVKLGRKLGWTGVALKTCKTQTGALLSLSWAKAHGMTLMVQDMTNPMLAQVAHVLLAAYAGTIMGVETNSMQFYPEVSKPEEAVHKGIYRRINGQLDLSTISGPGFGYRLNEIKRTMPDCSADYSKPDSQAIGS